ncbi:ParA family protein [Reinekea thalattae]|uniref:ParA family protein n=1 Tax=Reinekea thalattae TaxID=2593301 RepID=A0A5C8ZAX8_9GAMM|nr:ParA family protein [Reinekea thalattae]TXR54594.1 ParA family protein [Reinekea thalattae]
MSQIFAITNQKGGVGKTTTAINLPSSLVAMKRKVLVVDLDPQGNATMGSGVDKNDLMLSAYDVLTGKCNCQEAIVKTEQAGFDLLPANGDLTAAEVELLNMPSKEHRLQKALSEVSSQYDYIFIDCPPSLNMLTVNALTAAQSTFIPMQCEYYALEGLAALLETIAQIQQVVNPQLQIGGILRTMYDPRNTLTNDVSDQLKAHFGDKLYAAVIPRNVRLAEAPSYGVPVLHYDKTSRGTVAYLALAGEFIRRNEGDKADVSIAKEHQNTASTAG